MKILLIGGFWHDVLHQWAAFKEIRDVLQELGHEVLPYGRKSEEYFDFPPDAIDCCLTNHHLEAAKIDLIHERFNAPVFVWAPDLVGDAQCENLAKVDAFFGKGDGIRRLREDQGLSFYWFPKDGADRWLDRATISGKDFRSAAKKIPFDRNEYPVVFTGYPVQPRANLLLEIQELIKPVELHVFGHNAKGWIQHGFEHAHRPAVNAHFRVLIARTKIVLCASRREDVHGAWSNRAARVLLAGGFALVKYIVGRELILGPDGERVVYWDTPEDCARKIKYYLEHDDERVEILERGYSHAKEYLTTERQVKQLLTVLRYEFNLGRREYG